MGGYVVEKVKRGAHRCLCLFSKWGDGWDCASMGPDLGAVGVGVGVKATCKSI